MLSALLLLLIILLILLLVAVVSKVYSAVETVLVVQAQEDNSITRIK